MDRFEKRIQKTLAVLATAGYSAKYVPSPDTSQDASIELGNRVDVQVDSRSGDAVAVNKYYGTGADFRMHSWDIDDDHTILSCVEEAMKHREETAEKEPTVTTRPAGPGGGAFVIQGAKRSEQLTGIADSFESLLNDLSKLQQLKSFRTELTKLENIHKLRGYCEQLRIIADELAKG